ncbi:MAG: cupin domain-containing protein [Schwartzia sp.]|nr:cupin domain-containing protein [Schwartzia sp. (in: firmicutes)]
MNIVLLSGGSGKRLWPLSNDIRSKQFIKIFPSENGERISMVQRVYGQIHRALGDVSVTIATSRAQSSILTSQLYDAADISIEPCRRDTFPAMALVAAYLHDVKHVDENEVVVVCPIDPYVEDSYFASLKKLAEIAESGRANLALMGIEPTYPSEKYGYIMPKSKEDISDVSSFKEKPDVTTAQKYIDEGALWNGGVFASKLGYLLNKAHEIIEFKDYNELFGKYDTLEKISFDYAVVEKEPSIAVMRYSGSWKDLGTWNTLTEAMQVSAIGNAVLADTCEDTQVINDLDVPVLCLGLKNVVVAASPEGILVTDKAQSSYIKPYVEAFHQPVMYAEKAWGSYKVIDIGEHSLTIKVTLLSGHKMNYHSHNHRDEVWTVLSGTGEAVIDGEKRKVQPGDIIKLPKGVKHTIVAETDLRLIEIQHGENIDVEDKIKWSI